ncbi:MAG: MFS transporter [Alphaproteobacteria bacterium]|jgi:MFS family permease|nr:MFS transporter [Alphaproteobacteria bacterium]MBT4018836.1 MFS transporter [Alphaproteobacteria bacterium]MBT4965581.1 MFS transporter [Alphaproteobacteria bacterium]MBT5159847.1 MFS transporter [Alphaproteobacteria bacterium]MBT6387951.1 MFS transporter [Alphaproteobacteria bacterium]
MPDKAVTDSDSTMTPEVIRLSFTALLAAVAVFGFTLGISFPMLALALESFGLTNEMIGYNHAMTAFGILVSSFFLPGLTRRFGALKIMVVSVVMTATCFLLLGLVYDANAWYLIRFVLGMAINGLFLMSETWINTIANDSNRGRYIGIYATVLAASFAAGPLLVPILGFDTLKPFVVCSVIVSMALVPLWFARKIVPEIEAHPFGLDIFRYFFLIPTIMGAVLLIAFIDFAAFGLLPVYAVKHGFEKEIATAMLSMAALGNVFLQLPIGWVSDRINRYTALILTTTITLIASLLVPYAIDTSWLVWPLLFIWGGFAYGIFTIALGIIGQRFQGAALVSVNATTAIVWGIGGIFGPPVGGVAMDVSGPDGLMWSVAGACILFLILAIYRHPGALTRSSS